MICTLNCWDHHWCWRCTSHCILAENLIIHNTEDGRKCNALRFMWPVQVLEKILPPIFTKAEISVSPSLQLSLVPTLLLLNMPFAHGSFQLPGNTVQLCFRTPIFLSPGKYLSTDSAKLYASVIGFKANSYCTLAPSRSKWKFFLPLTWSEITHFCTQKFAR